jgi:hypothetical protein
MGREKDEQWCGGCKGSREEWQQHLHAEVVEFSTLGRKSLPAMHNPIN